MNTICCQDEDFACFTSSFVARLYNTIGLWASYLTGHTAQDASTINYDLTNSEVGSFSSIFEYAAIVEQAYGQQMTPSSPAMSIMESESQALYKLLYGKDDEKANHEQGQEPACSIGMEDCTCCDENDLVCLGSSALSKIGRNVDKAYNHISGVFSAGKACFTSAFSRSFDMQEWVAPSSPTKLKPTPQSPKAKHAPPASMDEFWSLLFPKPLNFTMKE